MLTQLPNIDQWDWGVAQPSLFRPILASCSRRAGRASGHSRLLVIVQINFSPEVQPGQTVNVVFRGFNPEANVYQWSVELWPLGEDPVRYTAGTLRTNVYDSDSLRKGFETCCCFRFFGSECVWISVDQAPHHQCSDGGKHNRSPGGKICAVG